MTNNGTFQTSHTTVTYGGTFTNNYSYTSDTSTQNFTNLVIAPTGSLTAVAGDVFNVSGDVTNNSTQNTTFNVSQAKFVLQGAGSHQFIWPGSNSTGANSFAIGTLEVQSGGSATISLSGSGTGINIASLLIDAGATLTLGQATPAPTVDGAGIFDAGDNAQDASDLFGGSNFASPTPVPEPGTLALLILGAMGAASFGRRKRMAIRQ